jgi:cellulose synthase/poly-beta-1,6-N-acetylglucosamine synthase-like glycosyltransferase
VAAEGRVSWLIPVRDGSATLGDSVASALAQCGPQDEVVVVDDGSVDQPERVLPGGGPLRLIRQPPLGIVAALERGRRACRGAFIARLDADDLALPGRIEAQLGLLAELPRVAAVGGQALLSSPEDRPGEGMRAYVEQVNALGSPEELDRYLLVESPLFHPATTLRAEALAAVGGWREGDFPEDYELWLRLRRAGHELASVRQPVLRILDRPDRLTRTDPRYRRAAFEQLKREHLRPRLLPGLRIGLWGAGRTGRSWLSWLRQVDRRPTVLVDAFARGERGDLPVRPPEALAEQPVDLLLVAVGARGAREEIRQRLRDLRPDLREGEGWIALA